MSDESFSESFRPSLYKWIWGGVFTMILSGILFIVGFLYHSTDWAKYILGGAFVAFIFGIIWIALAYFYRRTLIKEGKLETKHSFFAELIYGASELSTIPKDLEQLPQKKTTFLEPTVEKPIEGKSAENNLKSFDEIKVIAEPTKEKTQIVESIQTQVAETNKLSIEIEPYVKIYPNAITTKFIARAK